MSAIYEVDDGSKVRTERLSEEEARYYSSHGYVVEKVSEDDS